MRSGWTGSWTPPETSNRSLAWGPGALDGLVCEACVVVAFPRGGAEARWALERPYEGALRALPATRTSWAGSFVDGAPASFQVHAPAGWLGVQGAAGASAVAEGDFGLLVWNVSGRLERDGGEEAFSTRLERERSSGAPVSARDTVTSRFVVLRLEGARLAGPATAASALFAPEARIAWRGTLVATDAHGSLHTGGDAVPLDGETLVLAGDLRLQARAVPPRGVVGGSEWAAAVSGDLDSAFVGGAALRAEPGWAIAAPAGAGALALLLLARALWVFAYSRLHRADALGHPGRRALYEAIRAQPGLDAAELGRRAGLVRPVARHHLHVLERLGLVRASRAGRARRYAPAEIGEASAADVLLSEATRAGIMAQLAAGGATQREIARSLGLSQRLVSYHLARLEAAGLVEKAGFPARYVPGAPATPPAGVPEAGLRASVESPSGPQATSPPAREPSA